MPQISLYIDNSTLQKVEYAAERQHVSISRWVADTIRNRLKPEYPPCFEDLFGSVTDDTFARPVQPEFAADASRERL